MDHMGRRTFLDMVAYWPTSTEPFAAPMNEIPKVVFSKKGFIPSAGAKVTTAYTDATRFRTAKRVKASPAVSPRAATWAESRVATGDLTEEINGLKQQPGKDILAHGGASFAQSLAERGLIDECRLVTHPAVLGKGLALFSTLPRPVDLKRVSSTPFEGGAVANVYRPVYR